jgi:transposase
MLSLSPTTRVYLKPGATDLRGGFERLYQLARTSFGQDPLSANQVFAFCNHRRTRLKLLFHDGSGLWIAVKRPDCGTFAWVEEGPVDPLTAAQLWAMVSGLEVSGWRTAWRMPKKLPQVQKTLVTADHVSILRIL